MTFDTEETIMDDFAIQRVTPPLVDPLTEAANAHLAALAEAEAAEMIIKPEEVGDEEKKKKQGETPNSDPEGGGGATKSVLPRQLTTNSDPSSSSCSLSEHQSADDNNKTPGPTSDPEDVPQLKVPIPLVEENKEPGVSANSLLSAISLLVNQFPNNH